MRQLKRVAADNRALDILTFGCKLEDIAQLAQQMPELRIMVNAMGLPGNHRLNADGPTEGWIADMAALAKHPNISIKITGQTMPGVDDPHNPDYYKPYYDELLTRFGPKRLVWASNWPTLLNSGETLAMTVQNPSRVLADLPVEDQRDIFCNNAARFYDLAE